MAYLEICPGIYQIGGGRLSNGEDCCVYLVGSDKEWALIDCGVHGETIGRNLLEVTGVSPNLRYVILTHGHIDHIGGLTYFKHKFPEAKVVAHTLDLPAIEEGRPELTAADWYGVKYTGIAVEKALLKSEEVLTIGEMQLHLLHTPGHTPGSISLYTDWQKQRVLFGQDIHGPFQSQWGSDKKAWRYSMQILLDLQADILGEGHYGVIQPRDEVKAFIQGFL